MNWYFLKTFTIPVSLGIIFSVWSVFSNIEDRTNTTYDKKLKQTDHLRVSQVNPHLLETIQGKPVFINNYTAWNLLKKASREEIVTFFKQLKRQKFNMISSVIFTDNNDISYCKDTSFYGDVPFNCDSMGNPDPLKPLATAGNDYKDLYKYDYWDQVDYTIDMAAKYELYICLHPTWGNWVAGSYSKSIPGDVIVFDKFKAYKYGAWLGNRFKNKYNVVWMLGGDRSAVNYLADGNQDFTDVWNAMAEGLADGTNGIDNYDGKANFSNILISYHPRKWAPNSSKWFHNKKWLAFNSIQDTPYDQIVSIPADYHLTPVKPTWLFEGRYEGATSDWAVRYQAYQTVIAGGFGHTYGSNNWNFPDNWEEIMKLPGVSQMKYLYTVMREIWTDAQFLDRMPDQNLIIGDQGDTKGDGMTIGDGDEGARSSKKANATSNRITAMRSIHGEWAMAYSANGRDFTLDLSLLHSKKMNAYWFNPRTGKWFTQGRENKTPTPFYINILKAGKSHLFNPPGIPGPDNDWLLILK